MARILDALDYAKRERLSSVKGRIERLCRINGYKMPTTTSGKAVKARINKGRWIADCECGGAEAVSRTDPIFFCFSCGNEANKGKFRKVAFPDNADEIESILLERGLTLGQGRDEIEKTINATPDKYHREWIPDETDDDLRKQNKEVKDGKK